MTRSRRILVVDDDPTFRSHAVLALRLDGFTCEDADRVDRAMAVIDAGGLDGVLTDIHMPDGGGLELLSRIRASGSGLPVILVTGDPGLATAIEGMRLAAVDYITKPVTDLGAQVDRALARAAARPKAGSVDSGGQDLAGWIADMRSELGRLEAAVRRGGIGVVEPRVGTGPDLSELSPREREVAQHIARGLSVADVAAELFVSPHTVRNHLKRIYRKLDVHSQVELVLYFKGDAG